MKKVGRVTVAMNTVSNKTIVELFKELEHIGIQRNVGQQGDDELRLREIKRAVIYLQEFWCFDRDKGRPDNNVVGSLVPYVMEYIDGK